MILAYRQRLGLTQQQLAGRSGLSARMVRDLESNRVTTPRPRSLRQLAAALELSAEEIAGLGPPVLRVGVLGPLTVTRGGQRVTVENAEARRMLARLALHTNAFLPFDEAPGKDVESARELSRQLGAEALHVKEDGCLLHIDRGSVDATRFIDLLEAGDVAEALRCWRGPIAAELSGDPLAKDLGRRRVAAAIACARADGTGAHRDLIAEVAAAEPLHEPLHAELMLALGRAGDRAAALRAYATISRRLATELDVTPGDRLAAAYRQLSDPLRAWVTPAQLPRVPEGIVARPELTAALDAATGVCVVTGPAGSGKSTAVLDWAHRVRESFPDGQLYVVLGLQKHPERAVLGALGVPGELIPADPAALYRSVLADRKVLVVLDDACSAAQVRPLVPGGAGCRTVVISREPLPELLATEAAVQVTVGPLTPGQAHELLVRRLGSQRVAAEADAVSRFLAGCGGSPLVVAAAAARAATMPSAPLCTVLTAAHTGHDPDLQTGLAAARHLDPHRPPLPAVEEVHTAEDARAWFTAEHDALLAGLGRAVADGRDGDIRRLAWLLRDHLDRGGHWLSWLAVEQAALAAAVRQHDDEGQATVLRNLGEACMRLGRDSDAAGHFRRAAQLSLALGDRTGQAHTLLASAPLSPPGEELRQTLAALALFRRAGSAVFEARALASVGSAHVRLGRHVAALAHFRRALELNDGLDDPAGRAAMWAGVGGVHRRMGEHTEAARCLTRSLESHHAAGDLLAEATVRAELGDVHHATGRRQAAATAWRAAAAALDRLGHPDAARVRSRLTAHRVRRRPASDRQLRAAVPTRDPDGPAAH
ncbi:BTAD domain-containing putative transcriptional regulator [Winogradskya humida]|uniref:HTH cro/C1-type domain-containing protein n=1 Tax=Winogradskya humida TaxID=113566 RepID=A0ABQ4A6J8_9ACTN|nr:BTAD domain-containing putative transcriptional regulator [Actinoplanes humidus]GIE26479.1 hypothetical protein Ahu01nite_095810 [Actinoplanes humidus]